MAEVIATRRSRGRPTSPTEQWRSPARRRTPARSILRGGEGRVVGGLKGIAERTREENPYIEEEVDLASRRAKEQEKYTKDQRGERIGLADRNKIKQVQQYLSGRSQSKSPHEKERIDKLVRSLEGKDKLTDIPRDIRKEVNKELERERKKEIQKSISRGGSGYVGPKISLTPEAEQDISKYCDEGFQKNEWAKTPYIDPFIRAVTEEIRKNDDAIVFYTLQVLTGPTKTRRNRSQMFATVNAYIFGDEGSNVKRSKVEEADRLHMAMYLATVTRNILLPRTETQKKTFDKIKQYARFDSFGSTTKSVITGTVSKCKKSFRKTEVSVFKKRDIDCTVKQWIEVYMLFPVKALRRACMNVVFDSSS